MVATGKRDGGLYVLERGNSAFIYVLKNESLCASYDLWHAHLGHVNHSVISFLNKKGHLFLTSLSPVNLRKIINCLIPEMNICHLMC